MAQYQVEYTDTFGGDANYSWVRRAIVSMPDLTHYGYTGSADGSYSKANKTFTRELMRKAKAAVGITGLRGVRSEYGDMTEFRPYRMCTVMFVSWHDACE